MKPERWQQIDRLFHSALEMEPGKREAYLKEACAGDESLREEVERLLAQQTKAEGFLKELAIEVAAEALAKDQENALAKKLVSRTVSHYRIIEKIGRGGMGEVYLAQDTSLDRKVAIKFLPPDVQQDAVAHKRFLREARSAAALDHPYICHINEVGETEGVDFLVMEYIPGRTMREMIAAGPLSEREILRLSAQMAEGLEAAHARGIVHCDLKPGNLMVTPAGQLKILDFGLAKLVWPAGQEVSTDSSSRPRSAAGTLPYMAPEQLTGGRVDPRSDIYAMGNVLYEMATGQLPFQETLSTALVNDIVHKPPPPPGRFRTDLSSRTEEIILKCLEKDPENRYQSVKELLVDLRRASSPEAICTLPEKRRKTSWLPWSVALLAFAGLTVFVLTRFWPSRVADQPVPGFTPSQVTSAASWEGQPAVSPDGSRIAYSAYESGNLDIYVTDIRGSARSRLTDDPADDEYPAWFPDGSAIAFSSNRDGKTAIWKVGTFGGGATLLLEDAMQPAISPDQSKIAFARVSPAGTYHIGVASLENLADVKMVTDSADGAVNALNPAWSPDSRTICYQDRYDLWIVETSGGHAQRLTSEGEASEPAWSPDGRHIYYASYREGVYALWRINAGGGQPERLTVGTGNESHPSISKDGRLLAHGTESRRWQLVLLDRDSGEEKALPGFDWYMPSIAPDGSKIVFVSVRSGSDKNLWVQPLDHGDLSGSPYRLTELDGVASHPTFSPDGKWIAFYRILLNKRDIWIVSASGGHPTQFTGDGMYNMHPAWSPDGSTIAFVSQRSGSSQIWTAPVKDGRPAGTARQLTSGELTTMAPTWSQDGAMIAFRGLSKERREVWLVPANGSMPARQITNGANVKRLRWDGRTGDLLVSGTWGEKEVSLRRVSPKTGASWPHTPAAEFGGEESSGIFDLSADGKRLVFSREDVGGHIWLLKANRTAF